MHFLRLALNLKLKGKTEPLQLFQYSQYTELNSKQEKYKKNRIKNHTNKQKSRDISNIYFTHILYFNKQF